MAWEWMGIDLARLLLVAMGNAILIAVGAGLIAYFERVIKRWKEAQALKAHQLTSSKDYVPADPVPMNDKHYQENYPPIRQPRPAQYSNHEAIH